jgi:SRSO17 transposase
VENCELGVFCAYATSRGRALIDRELYLPKSWTEHRYRCREAGVPGDVQFATKPELARMMLGRHWALLLDRPAHCPGTANKLVS